MSLFRSLETFAAVAESRNFSEAAQKLRLTPSAVSKQIASLEEELSVNLISRTTHSVSLTDAGVIFLEKARRILSEVAEARHMAGEYSEAPRGLLRISAPTTFGRLYVSPLMAPFVKQYPELRVELRLSERAVEPVKSGVDIAINIGSVEDSNLIAVKIAPYRRIVCANRQYLEAHGYPEKPEDLSKHNCLVNTRYTSRNTWYFAGEGAPRRTVVSGTFSANSGGALIDAALGGLGIVLAGTWLASRYVVSGQLVPLLIKSTARTTREAQDLTAFYPKSTYKSPAVRAFTHFLRKQFGSPPVWDAPLIRSGVLPSE